MKKVAGMRMDRWRVFDIDAEWSEDSFPGLANSINYTELWELIADLESLDWKNWIEPYL
jgi:hypothetical protein